MTGRPRCSTHPPASLDGALTSPTFSWAHLLLWEVYVVSEAGKRTWHHWKLYKSAWKTFLYSKTESLSRACHRPEKRKGLPMKQSLFKHWWPDMARISSGSQYPEGESSQCSPFSWIFILPLVLHVEKENGYQLAWSSATSPILANTTCTGIIEVSVGQWLCHTVTFLEREYSPLHIILIGDHNCLQRQRRSFGSPNQPSSIQQASKMDEEGQEP